jgi:hypothetical protein
VLRDPYNFDFLTLAHPLEERKLERGPLAHMRDLLLELGRSSAFVGRQVPLTVGDETFYLDLLFYHVRLHCYFVIELKTGNGPVRPSVEGMVDSKAQKQLIYWENRGFRSSAWEAGVLTLNYSRLTMSLKHRQFARACARETSPCRRSWA